MDCARNIITANFSGGTSATTAPLWQWDYGQVLCITGLDLPAAFEVHFSTNKTGGVSTTAVGADGQVTIPNVLLTIGKNLNAWIYLSDAQGEGETEYSILIPVKARPMPETYDAEVTGEFDDVVRQVSEYAETAQTAADNAGASASAAAASASEAAASASAAETAKNAAETAQGNAEGAQAAAETAAQTATEKAQQSAQDASQAASDAGRAESAAERAESAETGAGAAKTAAEAAAQSAAASAATANEKATLAGQSATAAAGSASAAAQSAASIEWDVQIASQKASEARTAAGQAVAAKDAAVTARQGAETAATNAGQSASTATTKTAEAAQSASNAAASETAAEAAATRAEQAAASLVVDDALSDTSTNPVQNKVITESVTQVKSAIDALKITDTASGAIASFSDGAAMPMESLTVEMSPIQDLHGYDSPWPAGGGKNLFDEDTVYAAYKQTDGSFICTGAQGNFTRIAIPEKYIGQVMTFSAIMRIPEDSVITNVRAAAKINGVTKNSNTFVNDGTYALSSVTFTPETAEDYVFISYGSNGSGNMQFKDVQLEIGSEATDFAPYSNVCPISGRTEVTVERTGINVWDEEWEVGGIDSEGNKVSRTNQIRSKNFITIRPETDYYIVIDGTGFTLYPRYYDKDGNFIGSGAYLSVNAVRKSPVDAHKMMFYIWKSGWGDYENHPNISINYPSTDHDYHAYDGTSVIVQLGQTVYGGTVDVTVGSALKTMDIRDLSALTWRYYAAGNYFFASMGNRFPNGTNGKGFCSSYKFYGTAISATLVSMPDFNFGFTINSASKYIYIKDSRYTDAASFQTAVAGVQLVYDLQPSSYEEISTDPVEMSTLHGQNNVWSDGDSVEMTYIADPKLYIARLTEPDADMVADANITSGSYFMVGNTLYLATSNIASGAAITPGVNCNQTNLAAALNAINA